MKYLKLDNLISNNLNNSIEFKTLKFNGGEQHIFIKPSKYFRNQEVTIEISIIDSDRLILLLLATDALKRLGFSKISLFCPYLPYSRQDRVCNKGESLSSKVLCNILNSQNYEKIYTLDNHSDVSTALLNNHGEIDFRNIFLRSINNYFDLPKCAFISPDAGSFKKVYKLAQTLFSLPVVECTKIRSILDGEILKSVVHSEDLSIYESLVIIDDICDGGRTFIEISKILKEKGAKKIFLFISHGIFSQNLKVFDGLIDKIFTTKSFLNNIVIDRTPFLLEDIHEYKFEEEFYA